MLMNKDTVMRMYRSIVWITLGLATWCCTPMMGIAVAQYPGPEDGINEQSVESVEPDTGVASSYDGVAPLTVPYAEQPFPPGGMPYPQMSPYQDNFSQTYNKRGVWFNDSNNYPRRYEFGIEYLNATMFSPGTDMVGDSDAFHTSTSLVSPAASASSTVGLTYPSGPNVAGFQPYNVSHLAPDTSNGMRGIGGNGLRFRFDIINPDDRMLMTDIWGVAPADSEWRPRAPADLSSFNTIRSTLSTMGEVPMDNGISSGATGVTFGYDADYRLGYQASAWGSNVDWAPNAFLDKGPFKMRALYGLTFMRLAEEFTFTGISSNFGYTYSSTTGVIDESTVTDLGIGFTRSNLYSRTTSYLAGPEIGIRYDLGGERLKFWGVTKVAIAVNNETVRLGGSNLYDLFRTGGLPSSLDFASQETHTHISPIFQQQIFAEAQVFKYLPVVRKMQLFREANFRFGYNFLLAGEVARPTKIIDWHEGQPQIDLTRSRWEMGATSFAIDWKY